MATQRPLVSVIMPCYNMERFIADTIHSVIHQTFADWELLITDDASTDGTMAVVQSLAENDPRIHWFTVPPPHTGIAPARNLCIQKAQGRYLAFLDADDIWHPEKLEQQLAFMQEKKVGLSYSSYDLIDEQGKPLGKVVPAAGTLTYHDYLRNTIIGCSTVMVDTDIIGEVTVPDFRTSEDTATWLAILKKGFKAYAIETPLTSYRIRKKSASSNKLKASHDLWTVYRQHEKLSFFKALHYFFCYAFNALKKRL